LSVVFLISGDFPAAAGSYQHREFFSSPGGCAETAHLNKGGATGSKRSVPDPDFADGSDFLELL
jgi:hypothetical protein